MSKTHNKVLFDDICIYIFYPVYISKYVSLKVHDVRIVHFVHSYS